jgi:hypothetical protein
MRAPDGAEPGTLRDRDRLVVAGERLVEDLAEQGGLGAEDGERGRPGDPRGGGDVG